MGQQLFKIDFQNLDSKGAELSSLEIATDFNHEHVHFFSSIEADGKTTNNLETLFIHKLREHLFSLTRSDELQQIDETINRILLDEIFPPIKDEYEKTIEQFKLNLENKHKVNQSLTNKFKHDDDDNETVVDESIEDDNEHVASFAIQSLTSILLLLIKSAQKTIQRLSNKLLH